MLNKVNRIYRKIKFILVDSLEDYETEHLVYEQRSPKSLKPGLSNLIRGWTCFCVQTGDLEKSGGRQRNPEHFAPIFSDW